MKYERKTRDLYDIIAHYPTGKEVVTTETSYSATKENLKLYREAEPGIKFTYKTYREKLEGAALIAAKIHRAIESARPATWKELTQVLADEFSTADGIEWKNIYYMGAYQGVRLFYYGQPLPSATQVYVIQEDPELPKAHADKNGKEIKQ